MSTTTSGDTANKLGVIRAGVGLYTLPEAAHLLQVSTQKLRRWTKGYIYRYRGEERFSAPVVTCDLLDLDDEPILTFQALVALLFVRLFRQHGVSLPVIRLAAQRAAQIFHTTHPFAVKRFDTDGRQIFETWELPWLEGLSQQRLVQELATTQFVIEQAARPYFRKLDTT